MITGEVPEGQSAYQARPEPERGQAAWLGSASPEPATRAPALTRHYSVPATSALITSCSSCVEAHRSGLAGFPVTADWILPCRW